jgi:type VI secretion system protein ImpF
MQENTLAFEIEAELWGEPLPLRLLLRTIIDLEDGRATVSQRAA